MYFCFEAYVCTGSWLVNLSSVMFSGWNRNCRTYSSRDVKAGE